MTVEIQSYLRTDADSFVPIAEVERYEGDPIWVPGAVVLRIDGVEVLGLDLWDDINWLWPFLIQAVDMFLIGGVGERYFPDQPLTLRIEKLGAASLVRVSVRGGDINRQGFGDRDELVLAVARAGKEFFGHLKRLCPGIGTVDDESISLINAWNVLPN